MDSPLVRVILATLGGLLLILIGLLVYEWILEEFPGRPVAPPSAKRVVHPLYHQTAIKTLQLFSRLPSPEKTAVKERLQTNLISMEQWRTHLNQTGFQILCLGELHKESTRRFLAEEMFAILDIDVLLLEATLGELKRLIRRLEAGRDYFPLLDADIMRVLRTVQARNPGIRIYGIEQTDKQATYDHEHSNPRDQCIAQNFWKTYEPGLRHIILFGALHCTNEPHWLFHNLCSQASPNLRNEMLNVRVLGEHQNGPLEAFVYFIDEIGIEKKDFVIPDARSLPECIYEWFPILKRQTLNKYRSLVVFRR